jgi:hypothetical protein
MQFFIILGFPENAYLGVVTSRPGRAFTTEVTEITEETMILSLT